MKNKNDRSACGAAAAAARALCMGIAVIVAALLTSGGAQAAGQFNFRICNDSSVPRIGVAVRYRVGTNPTRYRTIGWVHVDAKKCTEYGPLPKGPFWFHAEESGTPHPSVQWGVGGQFCVDRSGKFATDDGENHQCDPAHIAQAFYADVQDDIYTWRASDRNPPAANAGYTGCQNLCVRQYNACREENGPNCLTLRQGCWDRCRVVEHPTPPPSSAKAPPAGMFNFHVCNNSRTTASVATSWKVSSNPAKYKAMGWTVLQPGACTTIGPFPQGRFWYYAFVKGTPRQWSGDAKVCVDRSADFTRTYGADNWKECHRDDVVLFNSHEVHDGLYNWNLGN